MLFAIPHLVLDLKCHLKRNHALIRNPMVEHMIIQVLEEQTTTVDGMHPRLVSQLLLYSLSGAIYLQFYS